MTDTSVGSKLGGRDFGYSYDPIGNRVTSSVGSQSSTYTPNSLNQYTQRTVPASAYVTGLAPDNAAVTVNGGTASRLGDYFYGTVTGSNGSAPQWLQATTASSLGGSVSRYLYLAQTPESYSYDFDGNLTADGHWTYTWDAENRLTSMTTAIAAYTAGAPRQSITFAYDYFGRRVRKTVANWNGSAYVASVDRKFIYDGWNLLAEYDALTSFTRVRSYVWGLDLTGTMQDGGGVGGLLAVIDVSSGVVHQPFYDGNGNVHALVNRSSGVVTAAYEFSAFGETLRATGSFAQGNAIRFSSKYTDDESGLLYYGRRYMSPSQGRFLGRDTIEEQGGRNLYAFCFNSPTNLWDVLGMWVPDGRGGWKTKKQREGGGDGGWPLPGGLIAALTMPLTGPATTPPGTPSRGVVMPDNPVTINFDKLTNSNLKDGQYNPIYIVVVPGYGEIQLLRYSGSPIKGGGSTMGFDFDFKFSNGAEKGEFGILQTVTADTFNGRPSTPYPDPQSGAYYDDGPGVNRPDPNAPPAFVVSPDGRSGPGLGQSNFPSNEKGIIRFQDVPTNPAGNGTVSFTTTILNRSTLQPAVTLTWGYSYTDKGMVLQPIQISVPPPKQ